MNKSRMSMFSVLFVLLLWGCTPIMAQTSESRAASMLFQRFETVFRSPADLLSGSGGYDGVSQQDANALRVPFAYLLGALDSLGKQPSAELLARSEKVLVGTKDYRAPTGLGSTRSQFCYVLVLKERNGVDLRRYFSVPPEVSAAGTSVWNWSAKLGEFGEGDSKPSSLYAAQIASYVLISNDRNNIEAAAKELGSSSNASQVLREIREWEAVSQHESWGYRRYRHTGVVDAQAAGMEDVTPAAEAIIFFVDFKEKIGVLRFLSAKANDPTAQKIGAAGTLPPFEALGTGVWQTRIPLVGDKKTSERMFEVMGLFGFGIYA